jgi:hypothetical protein
MVGIIYELLIAVCVTDQLKTVAATAVAYSEIEPRTGGGDLTTTSSGRSRRVLPQPEHTILVTGRNGM